VDTSGKIAGAVRENSTITHTHTHTHINTLYSTNAHPFTDIDTDTNDQTTPQTLSNTTTYPRSWSVDSCLRGTPIPREWPGGGECGARRSAGSVFGVLRARTYVLRDLTERESLSITKLPTENMPPCLESSAGWTLVFTTAIFRNGTWSTKSLLGTLKPAGRPCAALCCHTQHGEHGACCTSFQNTARLSNRGDMLG